MRGAGVMPSQTIIICHVCVLVNKALFDSNKTLAQFDLLVKLAGLKTVPNWVGGKVALNRDVYPSGHGGAP